MPRDRDGDPHRIPEPWVTCMPNANPEAQRSPSQHACEVESNPGHSLASKVNHCEAATALTEPPGSIWHNGSGSQESDSLGRFAKETHEMGPVALLTPTYARDLEICTLLCESVDRHVKSFSKHYLLVPDRDM